MTKYQFTVTPRIGDQTIPVNLLGFKTEASARVFQDKLRLPLDEAVEDGLLDGYESTPPEVTVEDEHTLPADEHPLESVRFQADLIIDVLKPEVLYQFTVHPRIDDISTPVSMTGFRSQERAERFQSELSRRLTDAVENGQLTSAEMTSVEASEYPNGRSHEPLLRDIDMYVESIVHVLNRI